MTEDEAVAALTKTNETLVKVSNETEGLLAEVDRLEHALEAAGGVGGTITPELEAAVKAVSDSANSVDQLVVDVTQP